MKAITNPWVYRALVIVLAPVEVIGCACVGAWRYGRDGAGNIRDAWRQAPSAARARQHKEGEQ